jgi:hypothetical protein
LFAPDKLAVEHEVNHNEKCVPIIDVLEMEAIESGGYVGMAVVGNQIVILVSVFAGCKLNCIIPILNNGIFVVEYCRSTVEEDRFVFRVDFSRLDNALEQRRAVYVAQIDPPVLGYSPKPHLMLVFL